MSTATPSLGSSSAAVADGNTLRTLSTLNRRASGPNLAALAGPSLGTSGSRRRTSQNNLARYTAGSALSIGQGFSQTRTGSLFRSEDMLLLRMYFDRSSAHYTVEELGDLGVCQFNDLNGSQSPFMRAFSNNIRRCDEMLRIVRFLSEQVEQAEGLHLAPAPKYHHDSPVAMLRLDDLDSHLQSLERTLLELNVNADALSMQYNQTCELREVLDKSSQFFRDAPRMRNAHSDAIARFASSTHEKGRRKRPGSAMNPASHILTSVMGEFAALSEAPSIAVDDPASSADVLFSPTAAVSDDHMSRAVNGYSHGTNNGDQIRPGMLSFVTGTLEMDRVQAFERVLFRATHGNCIVRFAEIKDALIDPETREEKQKMVFMVFFAGSAVRAKVTKICDAFAANRYSVPEDHRTQMVAHDQCRTRLEELKSISSVTNEQRRRTLMDVAMNLMAWRMKIKREMGVFHTLNLLNYDTSNRLFIAEVWCPERAQDHVREALEVGRRRSNAQVPSVVEVRKPSSVDEVPPTCFKTNKFTSVFQAIVESYGVAKYQEINPAPYTVVTFPFLFAVMFGDIGHGMIMTVFALYLVANEARLNATRGRVNEILRTCFDGRYLILLMGIFSVFTGIIYNEFFAVPLDLFGTRWKYTASSPMACGIDNCADPAQVLPPMKPYPIGFDPIWKTSKSGLLFFNSYKMKLSIVLGVLQMVMGICLSYANAKFFKQKLDILYVFIPQMVFMNAVFGYLVFLILFKWTKNFNAASCISNPECQPPDLKTVLISMFMSPGNLPSDLSMFLGQNQVQFCLMMLAVVAVPWMLLPKPLILLARHRRRRGYAKLPTTTENAGIVSGRSDIEVGVADSNGCASVKEDAGFDFADVFVHQMIHTIEFVLGAVSNTASYLRLWALSLAHAELSNVFLEKLLYGSIATGNPFLMIVGFFLWISLTMGVLMGMESLSAFLHALRLHWVEFQNKFYLLHGDGRKFMPFDFQSLTEEED